MNTNLKALKLLCEGYKQEFIERLYHDERFVELAQTIASEFVETNIPVVDEDTQFDLALLLFETIVVDTN